MVWLKPPCCHQPILHYQANEEEHVDMLDVGLTTIPDWLGVLDWFTLEYLTI